MPSSIYKTAPLLIGFLLLHPSVTEAAILDPYVLDEKDQVLFGDSFPVGEFNGLENYTYKYVDEYLQISFTYTHHSCCFASYPPNLYITATDPRNTSQPNIKSNNTIFLLNGNQFYPNQESNWYSYNIQFDSTGYRQIVKEAGETDIANIYTEVPGLALTDWISLANTYPVIPNLTPYSMAFTPVKVKQSNITKTPVIIIPGIMGSYLNKEDGTEVWMNISKMLLEHDDSYLNDLILSVSGLPESPVKVGNVIIKTPSEDFFESLVENLKNTGYQEGMDLFVFPYDWRLDMDGTSIALSNFIEEIKTQTSHTKVDIISHSMGGLLSKSYIKNHGDSLNKFIDIGTPHIGSIKSFKILNYGDNLNASIFYGLLGLNSERVRVISQNMPSVYELLPSAPYGNYLYDLDDFDQNEVRGSLNYRETEEFLKNTGRNSLLVDQAEIFHDNVDNLDPSDYGVEAYNIVGCGTPTLDKIFILNKENGGTEYNISYTNGDGTVSQKSAEAMPALKTYYVKNAVHSLMPSTSGVKELVTSILNNEDIDLSSYSNISKNISDCKLPNGKIVSFHSPIDLHIYDSQGRHTGPNENGDIEQNIPGIAYDIIDGNKFAYLPGGEDYMIKGSATGSGTFNARIQKVASEIVVETQYFNSISLTTSTRVEITSGSINIDNNGDGVIDMIVLPSSKLDQTQSGDLVKPVTTMSVDGKKKDLFEPFSKPVTVSFSAIDDNSGVLKTEFLVNGLWIKYTGPFSLSSRGENKIQFKSTDKAGNVESIKSVTITINPPGNSGKK